MSFAHPQNALESIRVKPIGRVIEVRLMQRQNAFLHTFPTVSGKASEVSAEQYSNALQGMLVNVFGSVSEVIPRQKANA